MREQYKHYKHIVDDTNGKSLEELKSEVLTEMSQQRLDGKAELEKALAQHGSISRFGSNLLLTDEKMDLGKITITGACPQVSSFDFQTISMTFESRDALLEALCKKVFGAKPFYKQ